MSPTEPPTQSTPQNAGLETSPSFRSPGKRPAVIVAMQSELQHLERRLTPVESVNHGPWTTRVMRLPETGSEVILVLAGIGMVNAAAATEFVCDRWTPSMVLNFGCAGAHTRDLLPGDVVIGTATFHQGAFHVLSDGTTHFPDAEYGVTTEIVMPNLRPCDPALVDRAGALTLGWTPDLWPEAFGWPKGIERRAPKTVLGVVASADIWTQSPERIDELHATNRSLCEDMEAAAINRVCGRWGVPFFTAKDISNNEYLATSDLIGDIEVLPESEVGRRAAEVIYRLLAQAAP